MMTTPYDRVIAALVARGSRRQGNNWQCPSHDDRSPSLTVTQATHRETGEPTVVMHCHALCSTVDEILPVLGLDPRRAVHRERRPGAALPAVEVQPGRP